MLPTSVYLSQCTGSSELSSPYEPGYWWMKGLLQCNKRRIWSSLPFLPRAMSSNARCVARRAPIMNIPVITRTQRWQYIIWGVQPSQVWILIGRIRTSDNQMCKIYSLVVDIHLKYLFWSNPSPFLHRILRGFVMCKYCANVCKYWQHKHIKHNNHYQTL